MAQTGSIKNMFPPTNNGTKRGAGMIDGGDSPDKVFQTPGDNNGMILSVGQTVTFEVDEHGNITSITQSKF